VTQSVVKATIGGPSRLTDLSHGGGCGCKLAPSVLQDLLSASPLASPFRQLLVGNETSDDAAVWQIDEQTCVVATTDFFMPIVDDAADFGRIAATNAISDIYAMGAKPIMALAILGAPLGKLPVETVRDILAGGARACAAAGIPVAGGHSIDSAEPIYGLAVIGTCRPNQVRRNNGARPGDRLILTKAVGVGVYSSALKQQRLDSVGYNDMLALTTQLNAIGATLGEDDDVHAVTDVTGFGLLGHALEMARGSQLRLTIDLAGVPLLPQAEALTKQGFVTGASKRNWNSVAEAITLPGHLPDWWRHLLTDPQTSGGLLVSCAAEHADVLLDRIKAAGYHSTAIIGSAAAGLPGVVIKS
jgi:selenide,water dikinase